MIMIDISVDRENQLAYVTFNSGFSDRTIEATSSVNVDLTSDGDVLGVEFLWFGNLNAQREELLKELSGADEKIVDAILEAQSILLNELSAK